MTTRVSYTDVMIEKPLDGRVAVVAGGTRGAGRGISIALGELGCTVYVTGRTSRDFTSGLGRKETIEETAEKVSQVGGKGVPIRVDHADPEQVKSLFAQVKKESNGGLDILANDIWGGDHLAEWGKKFWEQDISKALKMFGNCLNSHIITSFYGAPLLIEKGSGLLVEVTDGTDYRYRGNLPYSLTKSSIINLSHCLSKELQPWRVTSLAITPGFLRSEAMLDHFGVTEETWREGIEKDKHFVSSETPLFVGRAVAALASDPNVGTKNGKALSSWGLSTEYDFVDSDGSRPHWGNYYLKTFGESCD